MYLAIDNSDLLQNAMLFIQNSTKEKKVLEDQYIVYDGSRLKGDKVNKDLDMKSLDYLQLYTTQIITMSIHFLALSSINKNFTL